jgi:biotin operon repressor
MVDLARARRKAVSLKSIAEKENLSEHYLEQLVPELRKAGLVKSVRGSQGGYILARTLKISMSEMSFGLWKGRLPRGMPESGGRRLLRQNRILLEQGSMG